MKKIPKKSIILCSLTGVILTSLVGYAFDKSSVACAYTDDYLRAEVSKGNTLDTQNSLIINQNFSGIQLDKAYLSEFFIDDLYYTSLLRLDKKSFISQFASAKPVLAEKVNNNVLNINLSNIKKADISNISLSKKQSPPVMMSIRSVEQENKFNSLINNAKYLINEGSLFYAETTLLKAVNYANNNPWLLAEIAGMLESLNKFSKADLIYQKALSYSPNRIEILFSRALCLYKGNYLTNSEKVFQRILSINPKFMLAHYNLGNIYYQKGLYYKALDSFNKAAQINPLSSDTFYNIGLTLESLNQKALALKYYKKCVEINNFDIQAQKAVKKLTQKV